MPRTVSNYARRYVRARAEAQMTCHVRIYRHEDPVFDDETGLMTSSHGTKIYEGDARLWYAQGGNVVELGDADINMMNTYVSIPWDSDPVPHRDDIVMVDSCALDPDLVDRAFRVMNTDGGGLMNATRKMTVSTFAESHTWEPWL